MVCFSAEKQIPLPTLLIVCTLGTEKVIKLNTSPLFEIEKIDTSNCTDAFLYFNLLLRRLKKYTQRYSMTCDKAFYNQLCKYGTILKTFTIKNSWAFKYYVKNSSGSQMKISVDSNNINNYVDNLWNLTMKTYCLDRESCGYESIYNDSIKQEKRTFS